MVLPIVYNLLRPQCCLRHTILQIHSLQITRCSCILYMPSRKLDLKRFCGRGVARQHTAKQSWKSFANTNENNNLRQGAVATHQVRPIDITKKTDKMKTRQSTYQKIEFLPCWKVLSSIWYQRVYKKRSLVGLRTPRIGPVKILALLSLR